MTFRHQTTLPQKNDRNVNKSFGALLKNIQTFSCISLRRSPFPRRSWNNLHCHVSKDKVSGRKFYKSPLQIFGFLREIVAKGKARSYKNSTRCNAGLIRTFFDVVKTDFDQTSGQLPNLKTRWFYWIKFAILTRTNLHRRETM